MTISITDEEWDELVPESFDTTALLRAVNAVDVLREDLNDREDGGPPQLRTDLLLLHQLAGQRASRCHREHRLDVGQKGDRGYAVVRVFDGKSRFAFADPAPCDGVGIQTNQGQCRFSGGCRNADLRGLHTQGRGSWRLTGIQQLPPNRQGWDATRRRRGHPLPVVGQGSMGDGRNLGR